MINRLVAEARGVKVKTFPPSGSQFVASTPIPGKGVIETLNFSWPSPINEDYQKEVQLPVQPFEEKVEQCCLSQEATSHNTDTSLKQAKPKKFTKLSVIEDTDEEEDEERTVPVGNLKNLRPSIVNVIRPKKRQSWLVRNNKSKQRKKAGDDRSKAADIIEEDEERTDPRENIENLKSPSPNNRQPKRSSRLLVQNNKNKQKDVVDDDRSKAVKNIDKEDKEDEELIVPHGNTNLMTSVINNSRSEKRPSLHVPNNKDKQTKEVRVDRSKDATNSQTKTKENSEPQLEVGEDSEHSIIEDQKQKRQNKYTRRTRNNACEKAVKLDHKSDPEQKNNTATRQTIVTENRKNDNERVLIAEQKQVKQSLRKTRKNENENERALAAEQKQEKQSLRKTRKNENENERALIADQKQEKQNLRKTRKNQNENERVLITEQNQEEQSIRKTRSERLNLSQQHSPHKSLDTANTKDRAPETELPAVTENTDDDRAKKSKKSLQESQSKEHNNSGKENLTSNSSRKRSLFSHEKTSFFTPEVSVSKNTSKKLSNHYSFLEEVTDKVPKKKKRFVSKKKVTEGLRRSKRTRVKPLAHWVGERLRYELGPDLCFEIVGVEPACSAESHAHRQRNNESEQIVFSLPLQNKNNPEPKMVHVVSEGREQDVECFSTLRPESVTQEVSKYRMLESEVTEAGFMKLAPSAKKSFSASPAHYVFFILKGCAKVEVHNTTQEVKPGGLFQVPKGISYGIENLSNKQMVLHFVMVKQT